jgi:hypothetical protein
MSLTCKLCGGFVLSNNICQHCGADPFCIQEYQTEYGIEERKPRIVWQSCFLAVCHHHPIHHHPVVEYWTCRNDRETIPTRKDVDFGGDQNNAEHIIESNKENQGMPGNHASCCLPS